VVRKWFRAISSTRRFVTVNAAVLMLTSAWMVGADPAPAPGSPAPFSAGPACTGGGCSPACDSCAKPGLFSRLRAGLHRSSCGCESAPACGACNTCARVGLWAKLKDRFSHKNSCGTCNTCGGDTCGRTGMLTRLRERFSHKNSCGTCSTCASGAIVPEVVPDPKDPKKEMPKGGVSSMPVQPIVTPVSNSTSVIEAAPPVWRPVYPSNN
jgi:hypothetical protein